MATPEYLIDTNILMINDLTLATRNVEDFKMLIELNLVNPFT